MNNKKEYLYIIFKYFLLFLSLTIINQKWRRRKIGVISLRHDNNIGNNLLKYAISIKLSEFGFKPIIIGTHYKNYDISFLKRKTNLIIINKNFSELKEKDYDILMVNSDQTWRRFDKYFYDYAFLKFAKNWSIPKFIYGASLGYHDWRLTKRDEKMAKLLLKDFKGFSLREKGSIKLVKKHLGIEPKLVLDPTFLIDKKYYLNLLKIFKNNQFIKKDFIFIYSLKRKKKMLLYINMASKALGYDIYKLKMNNKYSVENFIYGIINCKSVITNSYHGTIFAIIFNKPFITFVAKNSTKERFYSLKEIFKIDKNRFVEVETEKMPNINVLTRPLNLNNNIFDLLRERSIKYLKNQLGLI